MFIYKNIANIIAPPGWCRRFFKVAKHITMASILPDSLANDGPSVRYEIGIFI